MRNTSIVVFPRINGTLPGFDLCFPYQARSMLRARSSKQQDEHELQSIFPTQFNGMGFLLGTILGTILNYKRDPYVHC